MLHHTMGCWPRTAGKIPASTEVPGVTLSAQESGRVRPVSLSSQARAKVTTVPGWGSHVCAPWRQHRDRVLFPCSAGAAPEAVSNAMLCPLPTPYLWICPQSPLSMPISRQHFPPELLGVHPGMRVLDSAPASGNCNPSVLSPVLVKLINPLCPLGKCYLSSALRGSWDAEQVLGALSVRILVPCPTGCRYRAV